MAIWCTSAVHDDSAALSDPRAPNTPACRVGAEKKAKWFGCRMFDLGPDLPNEIRNAVKFAGLKIIGDLRETTDETFASIPNLGPGPVKWLRAQLSERRRETRIQ